MREGLDKQEAGFMDILIYSNGAITIQDLYELPGYLLMKYQKSFEEKIKLSARAVF